MTIKRIVSLIMAALMVFSVFTMTAVAAVEPAVEPTGGDGHMHTYERRGLVSERNGCSSGEHHVIYRTYAIVCTGCNDVATVEESSGTGNGSSDRVLYVVSQYHSGVNHFYTYAVSCSDCGGTYTRNTVEYCGNPCGGIHLSVPDENI